MKFILTHTKSRHLDSIENHVRTDVPFIRGATERGSRELNAIAKKFIKKSVQAGYDWADEIGDIIAESNPVGTDQRFSYEAHNVFRNIYPDLYAHAHGDNCEHLHFKAPDENRINIDFERIFGREVAQKLDAATKKYMEKLMDTARVDPGKSKSLFQDMYFETVIASGDDAFRNALAEWEKQSQAYREANPFTGNKTTFFDKDLNWIQKMYEDGYKRVTTLGRNNLLKAKNLILAMQLQEEPLTIAEMTKELSKVLKGSEPYQLKRIIRTEMVGAADKENYERAKEMGVPYQRISIAPDACPICKNYREYNRGYYVITQAPDIPEDTHPNCRCSFIQVWNLPKGVSENGNEREARAQL